MILIGVLHLREAGFAGADAAVEHRKRGHGAAARIGHITKLSVKRRGSGARHGNAVGRAAVAPAARRLEA